MNAPDRYEKFTLPPGAKKISWEPEGKVEHAMTFTILREDHTVGNLMRMQLLKDPHVTFAGYKIPHPLEYQMIVKVQTDGTKSPQDALRDAIVALEIQVNDVRNKFEEEVDRIKPHARQQQQMEQQMQMQMQMQSLPAPYL